MRRVTLNGIKRVGLSNWKGREWWIARRVRIWSSEDNAWWRSGGSGYTITDRDTGEWDFPDAYEAAKDCGPEKRIVFYTV